MAKKMIIIGNGMSGLRFIEKMVSQAEETYFIRTFGEETDAHYNRVGLSSFLQKEVTEDELFSYSADWYEKHDIHLHTNEKVIAVNQREKIVTTSRDNKYPYDKLVFATGSSPARFNLPGADHKEVFTFRTLKDAKQLKGLADNKTEGIIVGGGFLGLEAAYGFAKAGIKVTIIQRGATLLNRQLDKQASSFLQKELEKRCISIRFNQSLVEIEGEEKVKAGVLQDGTKIPADFVLFTAGIKPNVEVAKRSGIATNHGILVNDYMETSAEDVYAVGECIEHNGSCYGLVPPVYEQAEIAADHITGKSTEPYRGSFPYSHLKIAGIDLYTAGEAEESETTDSIVQADSTRPLYKKIILQDDIIKGAVLFGETAAADDITKLIKMAKPLSVKEKQHLFTDGGSAEKLVSCSADTIICKCNQVNKQSILQHIAASDEATTQSIRTSTGASSSCGGCSGDVAGLLKVFDQCSHQAGTEAFCSCTPLEEDEVMQRISTGVWSGVEEVIHSIDWHNNGCGHCIPALRYYFSLQNTEGLISPPWIREDEGRMTITSLPVDEKDTMNTLRKWMEVKESIPDSELAVIDNRQLQLSGIPLQLLEKVCGSTDTPMAAQEHSLLRPFTLYSTADKEILEKLEQNLFPLSFPAPLSISSTEEFPELLSRDGFTLVRTGRLWELHVANGRDRIILYVIPEEELQAVTETTIQLYRETAYFNESFADWTTRISAVAIREILFSEDERDYLQARLQEQIIQVWSSTSKILTPYA
ncbi:FAD-dependent oxidoreductase [Alteribacillus sp. HJP-4]|uniref:FAD-dependent oxidoreductase n=1 Tax=Alteribacillus sp. HJP-4 TaxID=2775394 RepID=UPI0035CCF81B